MFKALIPCFLICKIEVLISNIIWLRLIKDSPNIDGVVWGGVVLIIGKSWVIVWENRGLNTWLDMVLQPIDMDAPFPYPVPLPKFGVGSLGAERITSSDFFSCQH